MDVFCSNISKGVGMSRIDITFQTDGGGGAEGAKCSRYHQNPDEIIFLFRRYPISYHHCTMGVSAVLAS